MNYDKSIPYDNMIDFEFNTMILELGSFLSILHNKKINPPKMVALIIEDVNIRELFMEYLGIKNYNSLIRLLIRYYPNLYKSKIITNSIKRSHENKQ